MRDYANKDWLRPTRGMLRSLVAFLWDCLIVLAIVGVCAIIISRNEAHAGGIKLLMLEPSMNPANGDECQVATGVRPVYTISRQNRSNEPWHHRTCAYK